MDYHLHIRQYLHEYQNNNIARKFWQRIKFGSLVSTFATVKLKPANISYLRNTLAIHMAIPYTEPPNSNLPIFFL